MYSDGSVAQAWLTCSCSQCVHCFWLSTPMCGALLRMTGRCFPFTFVWLLIDFVLSLLQCARALFLFAPFLRGDAVA